MHYCQNRATTMRLKVTVVGYIENYNPVGSAAYGGAKTLEECVEIDASSDPIELLHCCDYLDETTTCEVVDD